MAKFAMYVVSITEDGEFQVVGTNDVEQARTYIEKLEPDEGTVSCLIHTTSGAWQLLDQEAADIKELTLAEDDGDDDEDDSFDDGDDEAGLGQED